MKKLKRLVARIYYTYGLFCASHPIGILIVVCSIILASCSPLLYLPLPGNTPIEFSSSRTGFLVPTHAKSQSREDNQSDGRKPPRWYIGKPVAYIQQIVVKAVVSPWQPRDMTPLDAFRLPLYQAFDVLQYMDNFQHHTSGGVVTLADVCLRVAEPISHSSLRMLLPQYSCFLLSPANYWLNDAKRFRSDGKLVQTIFSGYGQALQTSPTVRDLLFGLPWKNTGISKYYIRNRQRVVSFAVTMAMRRFEFSFVDGLRRRLESAYPDTELNVNNSEVDRLVHVFFKDVNYVVEYTPLLFTYFILLLYIYFSVRKIEMVKSQIGLAISAVITVLSSLAMSLSLCFCFGLNPSLNGSEIFPYLVMIIGLENVLVITKSVVSTPVHMDVKLRVAHGLSKEGWYITKNLCTELLIIIIGFFTFVPAIQEFTLFALVGLFTDFFLQIFFFATILSLDIRRMELSDLDCQIAQASGINAHAKIFDSIQPLASCPFLNLPSCHPTPVGAVSAMRTGDPQNVGMESTALPRTHHPNSPSQLDVIGIPVPGVTRHPSRSDDFFEKMPKRMRFFYFWAQTRIFQRLIMVCTVFWIALILHKVEFFDCVINLRVPHTIDEPNDNPRHAWSDRHLEPGSTVVHEQTVRDVTGQAGLRSDDDGAAAGLLRHADLESWRGLSHKHWPTFFGLYNFSLSGRYITILPTIHLSINLTTEQTVSFRRHSELLMAGRVSEVEDLRSVSVARQEEQSGLGRSFDDSWHSVGREKLIAAFYPKSWHELFFTACFSVLSVIVISYFMVALYRCLCSRNYSRWRHRWTRHYNRRLRQRCVHFRQIKETVPLLLEGHTQEVECLAVDGQFVASCCYGGELRFWDSNTGECLSVVRRYSVSRPVGMPSSQTAKEIEDSECEMFAEADSNVTVPENTSSTGGPFSGWKQQSLPDARFDELCSEFHADIDSSHEEATLLASLTDRSQGFDFRHAYGALRNRSPRWQEELSPGMYFDGCYDLSASDHQDNCNGHRKGHQNDCSFHNGGSSSDDVDAASSGYSVAECLKVEAMSPVWCLAVDDGLIVAGCGDGSVEIWQGETGRLRCRHRASSSGVTCVCSSGRRVTVARIDGSIEFLQLETLQSPKASHSSPLHPSTLHRTSAGYCRRSGLHDAPSHSETDSGMRCVSVASMLAHRGPIKCLVREGDLVVSGSDDHTLKVFLVEDVTCLFTLHGHEAAVEAVCVDKCYPWTAASGALDGSVRLWEIKSGVCTHSFNWHHCAVVRLAVSSRYVVSIARDGTTYVWGRTRSQLICRMTLEQKPVAGFIFLSYNIGVIGAWDGLELWDLPRGVQLRRIGVRGRGDAGAPVTWLLPLGSHGLVCSAGSTISVITFPTVLQKQE